MANPDLELMGLCVCVCVGGGGGEGEEGGLLALRAFLPSTFFLK